jgi:FixJ family two-component response regulator
MSGSGTVLRAQRPRSAVVLVADEALASAIIDLMKELGWETWEVETFRDARLLIEQHAPGVFVVDPGLHVDLLDKFIRKLGERESTPGVVVLSDLISAATIADEHDVTFVKEPFELDDLTRAVEAARYPTRIRARVTG